MTAGFAVVLLVVGQVAALAHEAETRHVTCPEHGEQLEAASPSEPTRDSEQSRWIGVDDDGGEHRDCAISRLLRANTDVPVASPTVDVAIHVTAVAALTFDTVDVAVDVILIAPKTSPPA
jgi:hypothetical protein